MLKLEKDFKVKIKKASFDFTKDGVDYLKCKGYALVRCLTFKDKTPLNTMNFFTHIKVFGDKEYLEEIQKRLGESEKGIVGLVVKEGYIQNCVIEGKLLSILIICNSDFDTKKFGNKSDEIMAGNYTLCPLKGSKKEPKKVMEKPKEEPKVEQEKKENENSKEKSIFELFGFTNDTN